MGRKKGEWTDRSSALLFVSLIVLVWNLGAFGRHFFSGKISLMPDAGAVGGIAASQGIVCPSSGLPEDPAVDCAASGMPGRLTAKQKFLLGRRVDVNRAGLREISELPGISDRVAEAVVETRKRIGGFRTPEDLLQVPGIKGKRLKKILPFLAGFHNN